MSKNLIDKLNKTLDSGLLLEIVDSVFCVSDVCRKIGYSDRGAYLKIIREYLINNEVDISHFTGNGKPKNLPITKTCPACFKEFTLPYSADHLKQVTCGYSCSNTYFRSGKDNPNYRGEEGNNYRVLAFTHYSKQCALCGFSDERALEVHHIDNNRSNNKLENLKVLCSNCHKIEHRN